MNGRIVVILVVGVTAVFAGAQWWFQTRAYYETVSEAGVAMTLAHETQGAAPLEFDTFEAIDADTSPLRFRACVTLSQADRALLDGATPHPDPTPLIAPDWFECFDAAAIGAALEDGRAQAFLAQADIHPGADRVIAVFPDGRAYAWNQLNGTLE